jgi:hypothetical protein
MHEQFKFLLSAIVASLCAAQIAYSTELLASFDGYAEGPIDKSFTDGGITFSDLDVALSGGPFNFIAEDASSSTWPQLSKPNLLSWTGYFEGPAYGLSRFRGMAITFPGVATHVAMDVFSSRNSDHISRPVLTLTAFLNDTPVSTVTVQLDEGLQIDSFAHYRALSIDAAAFDRLTLRISSQLDDPPFALMGIDNVRATVIPEPSILALSVVALAALPTRRRKSVPRNRA